MQHFVQLLFNGDMIRSTERQFFKLYLDLYVGNKNNETATFLFSQKNLNSNEDWIPNLQNNTHSRVHEMHFTLELNTHCQTQFNYLYKSQENFCKFHTLIKTM